MFSLSHFFYGLVAIALGVLGLKYTYQVYQFTGPLDWIESHLGGGSTHVFYKFLSVCLVFFGIVYGLGLIHLDIPNPFSLHSK